jgi:TolA-binding protein
VLKKKISDDMRKRYQVAFQSYISGDWIEAKQSFEEIMRVIK